MLWSDIEAGWAEFRVSAKRHWDKLSEEQLTGIKGRRDYLASRVQEAYSLSKQEAERQVADWQARQMRKPAPADAKS